MSETAAHDHEFEVLEDDQTVPPRPEELIADAGPDGPGVDGPAGDPAATGDPAGPSA
ncbi:hypothetical protein [Terrabacter terrigena]|uniref:Uncharacterized protein n=1 Tax=Terrabacter terrigena TaxID=574718 RepID=A0ABW3MRI2_9MICO